MARFMARAQGSRGEVTRLGGDAVARVQGWTCGLRVDADQDGKKIDVFTAYLTGGSRGNFPSRQLVQVVEVDNAKTITLYNPETGKELGTWIL